MSDKKRRDITLGEMQDECGKHKKCQGECQFESFCTEQRTLKDPSKWNLTDPPRFTEVQMALLKALRGLGFISIENIGGGFKTTSEDGKTGLFMELLGVKYGEKLDIAELLGKDGAEC